MTRTLRQLILLFTVCVTLSPGLARANSRACVNALVGGTPYSIVLGPVRTVKSEIAFEVEDSAHPFFFFAQLINGTLSIHADLSDSSRRVRSGLRGDELYAQMIQHFGIRNIRAIAGEWNSGTNFDKFFELRSRGLSKENAAAQTWSGRQAAKYGFTVVRSVEVRKWTKDGDLAVSAVFVRKD